MFEELPPVRLKKRERAGLEEKCRGSVPVRISRRARVLLELAEGWSVPDVARLSDCSEATVKRVRRRYFDEGWERAVSDGPRPGRPRKHSDKEQRKIIALACTHPPDGRHRWTIRLLAKHSGASFGVVQKILKEDGLKPWREKNVVRSHSRR